MGFNFASDGTPVQDQVRRIAVERLDHALDALASPSDRATAIHDARKDLKKLRGLIRLVRPAFSGYAAENAAFRDIARMLAESREAAAMLECWDKLMDRYGAGLDAAALNPLHDLLTSDLAATHEDEIDLPKVRDALSECRARAATWTLSETGFAALKGGLKKTYGRAIDAMEVAHETRADEDFHDWRKRVKYHWYHARLLKVIAPAKLDPRIDEASRLNDILGDHHDLVEFVPKIAQAELSDGARRAIEAVVRTEILRLEDMAFEMGPRLLAKSPKRLGKRWKRWWRRSVA